MVIYDLICDFEHSFEGWFKNQDDLQSQMDAGWLTCPVCGSADVTKKVTAAKVTRKSNSLPSSPTAQTPQPVVRADSTSPEKFAQFQKLLGKVHEFVEQNFEDVGNKFAEKAIKMHHGDEEQANIRGVATREQVKEMAEEGIEAYPLPPKPIDPEKLN